MALNKTYPEAVRQAGLSIPTLLCARLKKKKLQAEA
jgi:hypothetical protein